MSHRSFLEVLFAPAEFESLNEGTLTHTTAVVFDVLRATTSMISALGNGARSILPVRSIAEAVQARTQNPDVLLAGERDGLRITSEQSGSDDFDFGNSPREFVADRVSGRDIVMTTTNGTRALAACLPCEETLVAALVNLDTTVRHLRQKMPNRLLVVCGGTFEEAALEDTLAAGALCDRLWPHFEQGHVADSALMARMLYLQARKDLLASLHEARNGKRLLSRPDLAADVEFCARIDSLNVVASLGKDGAVRRVIQ